MKFLQKLGKSLMLPVACLPICGILMGLGYWMCPATMQGGEINGIIQQIGVSIILRPEILSACFQSFIILCRDKSEAKQIAVYSGI